MILKNETTFNDKCIHDMLKFAKVKTELVKKLRVVEVKNEILNQEGIPVHGMCYHTQDGQYDVFMLNDDELLETMLHEFVHIKQFSELSDEKCSKTYITEKQARKAELRLRR